MEKSKKWGILILLFLLSLLFSLMAGYSSISLKEVLAIPFSDTLSTAQKIFIHLRMPRTIGACFAGAAMAVSGRILQQVLSNPLASPNVIGITSGAGFGTVIGAILLPYSLQGRVFFAFAGAFLAAFLVLTLARKMHASRMTIVLAGLAISQLFSAGIDLLLTLFDDAMTSYASFKIGSLAHVSYVSMTSGLICIGICLLLAWICSPEMDILSLGNETASSLGLSPQKWSVILLAIAGGLAAGSISYCGMLGFIGLIVPHISRRFFGLEGRQSCAACMLAGSIFLLLADTVSRIVFSPYEMPAGILLSLLGCPFFLYLLFHMKRSSYD